MPGLDGRPSDVGRLGGVTIESGVNAAGEPFCHIVATSADELELHGQLDPFEVRRMALAWLEAAEASVHDAAVYTMLIERVGITPHEAVTFVARLRHERADDRGMAS